MFDYQSYKTGIEVLHGAIQQLNLVPLDEMEYFLEESIEATIPENGVSKAKIAAAIHQLELIRATKAFMTEVQALLAN